MSLFSKIKNLPNGVKTAAAFFIASLISKGMSFITTPIFTRLMTSDEYGQVSLFLSWLSILGIIAMFSLDRGVYNVGMMEYKDKRKGFSFSLLILSNLITLVVGVVVFAIYPYISDFINLDRSMLLIMFAVFLTQPAYTFFIARSKFEYRYKPVLISAIVMTVVPMLMSLLLVVFGSGDKAYARIIGLECTNVIIYLVFYAYHIKVNKFKVNTSYWKDAFLFNLPLLPHYLSQFILSGSDRIMISYLESETATAYYSVTYSIGAIAILVWNAVDGTLVPYMYKNCEKRIFVNISNICIPIVSLVAICCGFVIMLAPEIVMIMAPNEYYEAIYVVPPIIVGVFFQVHFSLYANIAYYYKKQKIVMCASITAASVNIILNFLLIPRYGYIAAGYTTLLSYIIQAVIDYVAMYKGAKDKIYDMRSIGLISIVLLVISGVAIFIYDYWYIRYGILLASIVIVVLNRKKIMHQIGLVKTLRNNKSQV